MCPCGYLAIDGGREQCIRTCLDLPTDEGNFRDFVDLSVVTMTISRRGLVMEAFATEVPMTLTGPDARVHQAQPGDWVVFEAEGGHSAWDADAFVLAHDFVG